MLGNFSMAEIIIKKALTMSGSEISKGMRISSGELLVPLKGHHFSMILRFQIMAHYNYFPIVYKNKYARKI